MKAIFKLLDKNIELIDFTEEHNIYNWQIVSDTWIFVDYLPKIDYKVYNYFAFKWLNQYGEPMKKSIILYNTTFEGKNEVNNEDWESVNLNWSKILTLSYNEESAVLTFILENGEVINCFWEEVQIKKLQFWTLEINIVYND